MILSNCTITNNQCNGNGGGVNIHGNATISGCTITSNTAGANGGGIYVDASGKTVTFSGSNTIQSNSASNNGGGIYFHAVQTINMSGKPVITGNTGNGGSTNNLYLPSNDIITCGTFESGSNVGVTFVNYNRTFTSGFSSQDISYFSADVEGATLKLEGGEAYITASGVLYIECSWTGGNTDGHVVKTTKLATGVNGFHIETDQTLTDGCYQFVDTHEYDKRIVINGNVKFILYDNCNIEFKKGIHINNGRTLTIYCQSYGSNMGKLRCTGDDGSANNGDAAIGGNNEVVGGSLVIHGGDIYAYPNHNCAAGIGGGDGASGMQSIIIWGGNIEAKGRSSAAGIGNGKNNDIKPTITIYGGTVNAESDSKGAGIGGSENRGNAEVTIYGGTITAKGGKSGAGIGGGNSANMDNSVTIYGGTVTATGGKEAAGIGGGNAGDNISYNTEAGNQKGTVAIYGGTVTATGGNAGAGIGGGSLAKGGTVIISNATVYATGGEDGAGIGGGDGDRSGYGHGGTVTITNSYVEATGVSAIGGGKGSKGGYVTIDNSSTVKVKCTKASSGQYSGDYIDNVFIGRGSSYASSSNQNGTLILGSSLKVSLDGSKKSSDQRVNTCQSTPDDYDMVIMIEPCDHSGANYSIKNKSQHKFTCSYCEGKEEDHDTNGQNNGCSKCGYGSGSYTLSFYESNATGNGYGTATTYTMGKGVSFTLPECNSVPNNSVFVGWYMTATAPNLLATDEELTLLKAAGDEVTVTDDVTYYARYQSTIWPGGGTGTVSDPYIIRQESDWDELSSSLANKKVDFSGKYLKLNADISVSKMVGTSSTRFRGNFDGNGHTLTFSYTSTEDVCAPFRFTYGATIKNLKTAGTITTSKSNAGGVVGKNFTASLTLKNVISSVTITSSKSGAAYHGGLVGYAINASIEGCAFTGKLLGENSSACGGLLGYKSNTDGSNVTIRNSLFLPTEVTVGTSGSYTFGAGSTDKVTVTNCFYSQTLGTEQGTQGYTVKSGTDGLTLDYGRGNNYGSITAYSSGLLYDGKLYTGGTTKVSFTPEANFSFTALKANEETLTANSDGSYTVTMSNANVTITAVAGTYELTLYDGTKDPTNTATIAKNCDRIANVTIDGRTLYKDNSWNTLCLPFDIDDISTSPLVGATIMELDTEGWYDAGRNRYNDEAEGRHQTSFADNGTLYLYFQEATRIEAGKPYLIKWASGDNIGSPITFSNVKIRDYDPDGVTSADGKVSFVGNYDPVTLTAGQGTYYLGTNNKLYYPSTGRTMNAFRTYFTVDLGSSSAPQQVRSFVMNIGGEETTGIVDNKRETITNNHWYDMQGRKLDGQPTQKGIYIYKGKKVIK